MGILESKSKPEWVLSKKERKYLYGNETKNKQKRKSNIEDKRIPNLANRIEQLINDIVLMRKGGYLTGNSNYISISDLSVEPRLDLIGRNVSTPCFDYIQSDSLDFGIALGNMTHLLTYENYSFNIPENVWGYILGLVEQGDYQLDLINKVRTIIEYLEGMVEERLDHVNNKKVTKKEVKKAIIDPGTKVERMSFPLQLQIFYLKQGSKEEIENKSGNILDVVEPSFEKCREYILFKDHIRTYTQRVTDMAWNKISGNDLFYELWNESGVLSSKDLKNLYNEQNNNKITDKETVSKIMADLAGQDRNQEYMNMAEKWNKHPIVREINNSTRRGRNWKTTAYGDIVGLWSFTDQKKDIDKHIAHLFVTGDPTNQIQEKIKKSINIIDKKALDHTS